MTYNIHTEFKWSIKEWEKKYPTAFYKPVFQKYLKDSKRHLDFGCGFGTLTHLMAESFPKTQFLGTDAEKEEIQLGKKNFRTSNLKLKTSKKITGKFDTITARYVLHHIKGYKKRLKEIFQHLNKKGLLIIYEFRIAPISIHKKSYDIKVKQGLDMINFKKYVQIHNRWSLTEFKTTLERIGFKTIECSLIDKVHFLYVGQKQ